MLIPRITKNAGGGKIPYASNKAVKDSVPAEFQIDNSQTELISPMSSRRNPKDLHSLDSKQYKQKMEITLEAATKSFQSANNDSHSNGRNLQKHINLAASIDKFRMSKKNYEDGISSLEEKQKLEQQDTVSSIEGREKRKEKLMTR